ncbi:hypothetical protein [Chitinophaga barathri]|uniref:DUF4890 domain-containing protein n=1 Tax=Chitinophaga barathri TaxID=1647451 RepID=A0A3N4MGC1_9BACT|nr:hypothetical protein [Chitinophaga barathri]RPD40757.1 hypothetical protein EG028_12060 [Chitinophaga barathri]
MKAIFLFIIFLTVAGIYAASAQQKTRDVLFPSYASDQAKLKATASPLAAKPVEATLSSSEAIRARIFTNYQKPAGSAAPRPVQKASTANLSSSKPATEANKEIEAQREALKKTITPKPDQGPDNSPKPKN